MAAIRNFAITLCVSLIIFGLIAYFLVGIAENNLDFIAGVDTGDETSDTSVDTEKPEETGVTIETTSPEFEPLPEDFRGSTISAVLIGSDYLPDVYDDYDLSEKNKNIDGFPIKERQITADSIIFVQVNIETREYVFLPIPANTLVTDKGLSKTLGSLLGEAGPAYIKEKVSGLLSIYIDYYALFTLDGIKNFIKDIGGIEYNVPYDMEYSDPSEGEDGLVIDIRKGTQKLSGEDVVKLLRYVSYAEGDASRRGVIIDFMKAVLAKITSPSYLTKLPELFSEALLSGMIETNFTEEVLAENLDAVFAYPDFTKTVLTLPGKEDTVSDERVFIPNASAIGNILAKYKYSG